MTLTFTGKSVPLSEQGLANVGEQLGTKLAEIWAVLHVETSGCGFLLDRRPKILFERHIFSRETNHEFDAQADISNRTPGGYGLLGTHQYERLAKAMALDEQAALRSASWGLGQIMGFNAQAAGYANVNEMITKMAESEDNQLLAMATFVKHNHKAHEALRSHDWEGFAAAYNGDRTGAYAGKLKTAFAQSSTSMPDLNVRTAQVLLSYLGLDPGIIDGVMGRRTRAALEEFQRKEGLPVNGDADAATVEKLRTKVA
jgi:N-acetylmuramidase/Putative peptidoglycan binding domain